MARRRTATDMSPEEIIDSCLGEDPIIPGPVPVWIPSGSCQLDWLMGEGWPCGRMIEVYGSASSGKTMLSLFACKNAIKMGGSAVYLDTEAGYNAEWAAKLGIPPEGIIVRTPYDLEEVHDTIDNVVSNLHKFRTPLVIVWDSMAASSSSAVMAKKSARDSSPVASDSRLNSEFFRKKVLKLIRNKPVCFIVINQVRAKIGGMPFDNETTTGGRATEFYSSIRLEVKRKKLMKPKREGARSPGAYVVVKNKKNKVSHPFLKADFPIYFQTGLDPVYELMYYGEMMKILQVTGNGRVVWKGQTLSRGAIWHHFQEHPDEFKELKEAARQVFNSETPPGEATYDTED
jgi:recombination protein RecA